MEIRRFAVNVGDTKPRHNYNVLLIGEYGLNIRAIVVNDQSYIAYLEQNVKRGRKPRQR